MESLNENTELERNAPTLFSLPKVDPFVLPDGFFERFPHEVQARIVESKKVPWLGNWAKRLSIALPVLVIAAGGLWWMQHQPLQANVGEVAAATLTPLSDDELDGLDDSDLLALVEETSATADDLGAVDLNLDETELIAYLEGENADVDQLLTELE
jgi:hypothetical protein